MVGRGGEGLPEAVVLGTNDQRSMQTRSSPDSGRGFFLKIIYLFMFHFFGCVGSSFLCEGFL